MSERIVEASHRAHSLQRRRGGVVRNFISVPKAEVTFGKDDVSASSHYDATYDDAVFVLRLGEAKVIVDAYCAVLIRQAMESHFAEAERCGMLPEAVQP